MATCNGSSSYKKDTLQTAQPSLLDVVAEMVASETVLQRVVGILTYSDYVIALLDAAEATSTDPAAPPQSDVQDRSSNSAYCFESSDVATSTLANPATVCAAPDAATTGGSVASLSPSVGATDYSVVGQSTGSSVRYATQILIRLPNSSRTFTYDMPRSERIRVPVGQEFAMCYMRGDRHVFCFTPSFALEVQQFTDDMSGITKFRCNLSRGGPQDSRNVALSPTTGAAVIGNLFKPSSQKKEQWQCTHPAFGTRYTSGMKHIKDFGGVHSMKFYLWGALLTSAKAESPFAMLLVEHPKLRKTYSERILVCIRGLAHASVQRKDIDVAVTAGLERVYSCCCSQIASANMMSRTSRLDFEIQEAPNKEFRLRLVHIDIPEGAPSGHSLGSLNCLGFLAEFNPRSGTRSPPPDTARSAGVYYQNGYCKTVCPRYTDCPDEHFPSTCSSTPCRLSEDDDEERSSYCGRSASSSELFANAYGTRIPSEAARKMITTLDAGGPRRRRRIRFPTVRPTSHLNAGSFSVKRNSVEATSVIKVLAGSLDCDDAGIGRCFAIVSALRPLRYSDGTLG